MLEFNSYTGHTELDGHFEGNNYSGTGPGRNNPTMEAIHNVGPIPRGRYAIGPMIPTSDKGPIVYRLTPIGHNAYNRQGLMIHGDNVNHDASHGCLILGRSLRERIDLMPDRILEVV